MELHVNKTFSGFVLLGFSDTPHFILPVLCFFLVMYILCIAGNLFIFVLIVSQHRLHTPRYVLMGNLAFVDVCFTSTIIPRALHGLLSGGTHISVHDCFLQLFLSLVVGSMDCFLLAVMALDRYCAVCFPLQYHLMMNKRTCICLVAFSWIFACLQSTYSTWLVSSQLFCGWAIQHFFCDYPVIIILSCSGLSVTMQTVDFLETCIVIFSPVLLILWSYVLIIKAVLTLKSSQGSRKTFSTCSSHLTMVILCYSTLIFTYLRPSSIYSPTYDRAISVVFTIINPTLNPFIYSLRNKEIKIAFKKFLV
ncbi:olfactory receptor 1L6-like [Aquarana catesbeiana]|uniref:olfactory receptor 1L6-like n=1 Tax=Aquarana catesbeiana TaxID=8400 RepID=UPI003CC9D00F